MSSDTGSLLVERLMVNQGLRGLPHRPSDMPMEQTSYTKNVTSTDSHRFVKIGTIPPGGRPATGHFFYAQRENKLTMEKVSLSIVM